MRAPTSGSDRPAAAGPAGLELRCADEREFTHLLKAVQVRSGLTPAKIGEVVGIPRSRAYPMVTRGALPTRFEQVARFVEVRGLPESETRRILEFWLEPRQRAHHGAEVEIRWLDYLEHLGGNASSGGDESSGSAGGNRRPPTRARRLDEMSAITRNAGSPPGSSSSRPERARRT